MTTHALFERYLEVLGVDRAPPSLAHLSQLVRAHLIRIPFETVSKLYYRNRLGRRGMPSLGLYLDGIERLGFGGTCYANNYYLYRLLRHLGYEATLCGADMSAADVHLVSFVSLDGTEYLVDVGYAAPFYEPLPRNLESDYVVTQGDREYRLHPQDRWARSRVEQVRAGVVVHGYLAKPTPRDLAHFEGVIADSYSDHATFMNAVLLARFLASGSVRIQHDSMVQCSAGGCTETRFANPEERISAVVQHFGMPLDVVRDGITALALGPPER